METRNRIQLYFLRTYVVIVSFNLYVPSVLASRLQPAIVTATKVLQAQLCTGTIYHLTTCINIEASHFNRQWPAGNYSWCLQIYFLLATTGEFKLIWSWCKAIWLNHRSVYSSCPSGHKGLVSHSTNSYHLVRIYHFNRLFPFSAHDYSSLLTSRTQDGNTKDGLTWMYW